MQAIFDLLAQHRGPLFIIGGHSLVAHGVQRMTFDVDCMVAAADFDALSQLLVRGGFSNVQHHQNFSAFIHHTPGIPKIDVMRVDAPTFAKMEADRGEWDFGNKRFAVPALEHLIAMKLHAMKNNPERVGKDGWDIGALLAANPGAIPNEKLRELCERFGPENVYDTYSQTDDTTPQP